MRKFYNLLLVIVIPALFIFLTSEVMYPTGSPGGKTGSPGDNGANCTECHSGTPINQEDGIFSPELQFMGYSPNQVYNILVFGYDENALKYGFEATAEDANGNKVGTFSAGVGGLTQTLNNGKAITHTALGTTPLIDSAVWFFTWMAPPATVGDITFYAAVNAANGNGTSSGDKIFLSTTTATPATGIFNRVHENAPVVFPNPSAGIIHVSDRWGLVDEELSVLNLNGQVVIAQPLSMGSLKFDLSHLPKGVYIVKVGNYSQRLILQN